MTRYKKMMSAEDRKYLEGLCARKYAYYRQLFEGDEEKKEELLKYAKGAIQEDIEEIGLGKNNFYNIKR